MGSPLHPEVDMAVAPPHGAKSPSIEIDYARAAARLVLKEKVMRTTLLGILCSFASACAQIGDREPYEAPDAGVDGGPAALACDQLETRTGSLTISGASGFQGLPTTCWKLAGKLTLTGPAVASLAKLGDLRGVTDLEIGNTELAKIDTKAAFDVTGDIYIHHNNLLADVGNVSPRGTIESLRVESNPRLTTLGGLSSLTIVSGATSITNNVQLASIALPSASRLEGGLTISDNAALTSILLQSLQSVGNVTISRNNLLTSIGTMAAMTNVHGTLSIDSNGSLTTLGSLGSALVVDISVSINNNTRLADLGRLDHAGRVLGTVQVTNNPALDVTKAHDIGCCVQTGAFAASNNKTTSCAGSHWCLSTQQNCFR
jgi:hypothetical protein